MAETKKPQERTPQNEGEGNRTAARQYNEAQRRFAESGKADEKAHEAEHALETPEKSVLFCSGQPEEKNSPKLV